MMSNLVCLITGATSGIGKYTALELANAGANVVMICRDKKRGQAVRKEIISKTKNDKIDLFVADLSLQSDIRKLADRFKRKYSKLDILINNAGVFNSKQVLTKDGIEETFAVNHLACFLLTNLLLKSLKKSKSSRIITVSSSLHRAKNIDFDDFKRSRRYNGRKAYARSKLANIFFTKFLASKLSSHDITVNCFHPGFVKTNLGKNSPDLSRKITNFLKPLFSVSPEKTAKNLAYLALSPEVASITGQYFVGKKVKPSSGLSNDSNLADLLWEKSEELTNFHLKDSI